MVVFPQPLELSNGHVQLSMGNPHRHPQEKGQEATGETPVFHPSTTPYYNYYFLNETS